VQRREIVYRPEPTLPVQHASATKIQGAFRGYMVRIHILCFSIKICPLHFHFQDKEVILT